MSETPQKKKFKKFHYAIEELYVKTVNGYIAELHDIDYQCEDCNIDRYVILQKTRKRVFEDLEDWVINHHEVVEKIGVETSEK